MSELTANPGWVAIVVSFVASFMLGWLWYSPKLFGKKWAEGVGVELADGSDMPVMAMLTQALGTFALAWLVGVLVANGAILTIILALCMLILLIVSNGKYAQKSNAAVAIEGAYIAVMGIVMLLCQVLF